MTLAAPPPLVVEPKAITISQYEALTSDIEIAKQQAIESFNYEDPKGDKAARSYIAGLRKIRSRIESARKDAKSYALEYGRAVDGQAKALESEILGLIEPHQQALDEIAQREKDRVAKHEATLQCITHTVQQGSQEGASSEDIAAAIATLYRTPTEPMEEFQEAAIAEINNGLRLLRALEAAALEREKREAMEAAEAQRLAEEDAARRKAEDEARVQAQIKEAASRAQADAEARAAQAEERARVAEAQRLTTERLAMAQQEAAAKEEQRRAAAQKEAEAAVRRAEVVRRADLGRELAEALASKTRIQVVDALLDGTLHPAVCIDWSKA